MKVVAQPIQVVCWMDEKGNVNPVRFKYMEKDESYKVIRIDRVMQKDKEKLAGNPMIVYRCCSNIEGINKTFEIKYELQTCKWMLFKI